MKTELHSHTCIQQGLLPSAAMETLKQFSDKHISMETHGQQYNINFELGHITDINVLVIDKEKDVAQQKK
jgi:heme/copper-type cytochrome/quinol oxidase subunit 2